MRSCSLRPIAGPRARPQCAVASTLHCQPHWSADMDTAPPPCLPMQVLEKVEINVYLFIRVQAPVIPWWKGGSGQTLPLIGSGTEDSRASNPNQEAALKICLSYHDGCPPAPCCRPHRHRVPVPAGWPVPPADAARAAAPPDPRLLVQHLLPAGWLQ